MIGEVLTKQLLPQKLLPVLRFGITRQQPVRTIGLEWRKLIKMLPPSPLFQPLRPVQHIVGKHLRNLSGHFPQQALLGAWLILQALKQRL